MTDGPEGGGAPPRVGEEITAKNARLGMPPVPAATGRDRGAGPFRRLVLRGATVIDGTGAPPWGPVDVVVEENRIAAIVGVGTPGKPIGPSRRPPAGDRESDCHGRFVTPGLIDCHTHIGVPYHALHGAVAPADYVYKMRLAHGVTAVREMGCFNGLRWVTGRRDASAAGVGPPPVARLPARQGRARLGPSRRGGQVRSSVAPPSLRR